MKYNSIGEQLIAKAQELDPNYKPDKFNDMSEALDVILNNTGGGDEYVDIVFSYQQFMDYLNGYNLTIPTNIINEEILWSIALGEKKGLLFKIKAPADGDASELFYLTIPFYLDLTSERLFTNVISIRGQNGYWTCLLDFGQENQIFTFNSIKGKVMYTPTVADGKITVDDWNTINELAENDQLLGVIADGINFYLTYTFDFNNEKQYLFSAIVGPGGYMLNVSKDLEFQAIDYTYFTFLPGQKNYIPYCGTSPDDTIALKIGSGLQMSDTGNLEVHGIYYDLTTATDNVTSTQYYEITKLMNNNSLAGVKTVLGVFNFVGSDENAIMFHLISLGDTIINSDTYSSATEIKLSIKNDMSLKYDWNEKPFISFTNKNDTYNNKYLEFQNKTDKQSLYKIPELPSDASTKTYVLKSVNGVLTWSE